MFALIYISRANQTYTDAQLMDLLRAARKNNLALQITGLLLYKDGNFMQLLEGEKDVVLDLFHLISGDPRHANVITLFDETVAARQFPDWAMSFQNLDSLKPEDVPGYSDFLKVSLMDRQFTEDPSRAMQLLNLFRNI